MPFLADLRAVGYRIRLDFLWIPDLDITRSRIRQRVKKGGHDIPDDVQQRRFRVGIRNLARHYRPLVHTWRLYDNTGPTPYLVAEERDGVLTIADAARLAFIEQFAGVAFMPVPLSSSLEEAVAFPPADETRRSLRAMRKAFADVVRENKAWGLLMMQRR